MTLLLKVTVKGVHEQTTELSNDNNIFCKYQYGFRSNHSTDLFLPFLIDQILKGFDNGLYAGMILIDLQKAFDTINHKILLSKLLPISFSKNTISSYESYLAEHYFTVEVANWVSKFANISWGCSARFNFRSSTVFELCQRYDPSYRMRLLLICR